MWKDILTTSLVLGAFLIIFAVIYYALSYKGVKKQRAHFEELHQSLAAGQEVVFSNGIYGVLRKVDKETVEVEIAKNTVIKVTRYAISEIIKN